MRYRYTAPTNEALIAHTPAMDRRRDPDLP
jgi:hypothetical protein